MSQSAGRADSGAVSRGKRAYLEDSFAGTLATTRKDPKVSGRARTEPN